MALDYLDLVVAVVELLAEAMEHQFFLEQEATAEDVELLKTALMAETQLALVAVEAVVPTITKLQVAAQAEQELLESVS